MGKQGNDAFKKEIGAHMRRHRRLNPRWSRAFALALSLSLPANYNNPRYHSEDKTKAEEGYRCRACHLTSSSNSPPPPQMTIDFKSMSFF